MQSNRDERTYAILRNGGPNECKLEGPMTLNQADAIAREDETAFILRLTPVDACGGTLEPEFRSAELWPWD